MFFEIVWLFVRGYDRSHEFVPEHTILGLYVVPLQQTEHVNCVCTYLSGRGPNDRTACQQVRKTEVKIDLTQGPLSQNKQRRVKGGGRETFQQYVLALILTSGSTRKKKRRSKNRIQRTNN